MVGISSGKAGGEMGCLGGKSEHKAKPGRYRCKRCGAVSKKKDRVCKPKKIKHTRRRDGTSAG